MTIELPTAMTDAALDLLFREARTTYHWLPTPVPSELIAAAWDLAKLPPTAMNCSPMRLKVVRSPEAKARLLTCMADGNKPKVADAPVTLVLAAADDFYERMPQLFPAAPGMADTLAASSDMARAWANDNAWLQAAYLMIALRAVGLACGPENGADFNAIDREFLSGLDQRSFLVVNTGFAADPATDFPRGLRLRFDEVAEEI